MKNRLNEWQVENIEKLKSRIFLHGSVDLSNFAMEVPKEVQDELFWAVALKIRGGIEYVHEIPEKFQNYKLHEII